jgi:hypothetical protein
MHPLMTTRHSLHRFYKNRRAVSILERDGSLMSPIVQYTRIWWVTEDEAGD